MCAFFCAAILLVVAVILAADIALVWSMIVTRASWRWWIALTLVAALGLALGVWCGFGVQYQVSDNEWGRGLPLTTATIKMENGEVVGVDDPPFPGFVMLFNSAFVFLACLAPLAVVYYVWRGRAQSRSLSPPQTATDMDD